MIREYTINKEEFKSIRKSMTMQGNYWFDRHSSGTWTMQGMTFIVNVTEGKGKGTQFRFTITR